MRELPQTYTFTAVRRTDLRVLTAWLETPEVVRWWGDPVEQAALMLAGLNDPRMSMEIVCFEGNPFAYAQNYDVRSWPQPQFEHLLRGARAIDSFIGQPSMVGHGHGPAYLRQLALRLKMGGTPVVAIDPDVRNLRARRAYEKGRTDRMVEIEEHAVILMIFRD